MEVVSNYNKEDQNYEENESVTKPTGLHLRKLESRYMEEQREIEENHLTKTTPMVIKQYIILL